MDNILKKIPMDIILKILSYDKRFIIRKGKIIVINLLDLNKFRNLNKLLFNNLLLSNPRPTLLKFNYYEGIISWLCYEIKFKNNFRILYHIDHMGEPGAILYVMFKRIYDDRILYISPNGYEIKIAKMIM
jgi:hypothetical protein